VPNLNQYLSLADLQPFFDNARGDDNVTEAWRTQYFKDLEVIVVPALVSFFRALKAEGRVATIPNSEGYVTRSWNIWNEFARLSPEAAASEASTEKLARLAKLFAHTLTHRIVWPYQRRLKDEGAEAAAALDKSIAFDQYVGEFTQGTFLSSGLDHETCQNSGLPVSLRFNDWKAEGFHIDVKRGGLFPIEPLAAPTVQETVLELKTGQLLVSDWFRIKAFTDVTKEEHFSLESRKGVETSARHLAEQFGVVSVFVSNSSPGVYQEGNQVIVGRHYEDDDEDVAARLTKVGRVCTDLWAATFVEYETLVELVGRKFPGTAKQMVDDYLKEPVPSAHTHRLTVEPGTYYLYHCGEPEEFPELAERAGIKLDTGGLTPFFVFSRTRLIQPNA
jgi:hypothetical protein